MRIQGLNTGAGIKMYHCLGKKAFIDYCEAAGLKTYNFMQCRGPVKPQQAKMLSQA